MLQRVISPAALLLTLPLASAAPVTQGPPGEPPTDASAAALQASLGEQLLHAWRLAHGASWRAHTSRHTGKLELLFGGRAEPSFEPDTNVDADWFRLAREWVAATEAMHGVAPDELLDGRVFFLPLGQGNTTDKMTVRLDQVIGGLAVEEGRVNLLFDVEGRLLSLQCTAAPEVADASTRPSLDAGAASLVAREAFLRAEGIEPNHYGAPVLLFAHVDDQWPRRWTLAWQVDVQWHEAGSEPKGFLYTIDARTRRVLKRAASVHFLDVTGTVRSMATPGTESDHPSNPAVSTPMPYMRVQSSAGTVYTDANGNFTFPGVNTPLDVTVRYEGTFTDVVNAAGSNHVETFPGVQPNQPNVLLMNPAATGTVTAQANGFNWVNRQRDWIRSIFPNDNTADFLSTTNVNLAQTCNAFFNGSSTNYYLPGGGCYNTCFSSVVAHEMGHWLNVLYGTGNGSDGMGEGNADVFSVFMLDEPRLAPLFYLNGNSIRDARNTRQYCGDTNPGCYGAVHIDGEVWMGAAWKIRTRLEASLGSALGELQSNLIFLGWMNAYDQTAIHSIIESQWLTLDDDDGNISNGTPNFDAIDGGFREQGFPGFELEFVTFSNVTRLPSTTDETGPYVVLADAVASLHPPLVSATLRYRVNGGTPQSVPMTNVGGDTFTASIPGQPAPAGVEYVLVGQDAAGNTYSYPTNDLARGFAFAVGEVHPVYATTFETGAGGWVRTASSASAGLWELGDPNGTAAQPEDDHTTFPGVNCWFTGQAAPGAGASVNDVDGGTTVLQSATLDMTGIAVPQLSYWRWFSNDQGSSPGMDVMRVEISNNGGGTWTLVETVGPAGPEAGGGWFRHEILVRSFVTPTSTMKLRFTVSDLGPDSIVEAALDDVLVASVEDVVTPPATYCAANPNSTGVPGTITFGGSQSLFRNTAVLRGQQLPLASTGLFFFGSQQVQLPVPGTQANLCVAGTTHRLPVVQTDSLFGAAYYALDFSDPATNAQVIAAGTTWNFQFWHRDSVGGASTSNMTNAVSVQFGL